ncbi:MAG TPA: SRPBCC family protein [Tepidisphaeraceae bacterium]
MATTRIFDAPRELVFKLWTDPTHVSNWWGPRGFTTTTQKMEVRPGGVWRFCMHGPDGRDYQNKITYIEVLPPERLVYEHGGDKDVEPVNFRVTVTFEDLGGKTKLYMQGLFPSAAAREFAVREYGAVQGMQQTLDRLGEQVAKSGSNSASS